MSIKTSNIANAYKKGFMELFFAKIVTEQQHNLKLVSNVDNSIIFVVHPNAWNMPVLGSIIKKAYELRSKPEEKKKIRLDPIAAQKKQLHKLLRKSQYTAFGEYYGFHAILNQADMVGAFRQQVPVFDYNKMYKEWWYRALNGETYVTWPGKVKYFALSSGTSEASSKHIPVTGDMLRSIKRASIRQLVSTTRVNLPASFYEKGMLMIGGSTHLPYNGTYYEGDLSGITTANLPFWFQHFYKPGKRISKAPDWSTKLSEIVRNAPNWDIGVIVGVPAWVQILLEKIIDRYKLHTIHDLWPNLSIYVHSGVSFAPYVKSFEKLLGKEIFFIESYLASEGYIAYQDGFEMGNMRLNIDNGIFFEFVPFNDQNFDEEGNISENPEAHTLEEAIENKEYALLLSTNAGAWRYLIGDTIKIINKAKSEIIITGRTKHFLSICGEHLSQENMNRAIELLQEELNIEIREFTVAGIRHENMFAHVWYLGTDDLLDQQLAAEKIDTYLKNLNDDYRVEREEAIKEVFVKKLPSQVFYNYMKLKGKEGSANKFPRVLKNKRLSDWQDYLSTTEAAGG